MMYNILIVVRSIYELMAISEIMHKHIIRISLNKDQGKGIQ